MDESQIRWGINYIEKHYGTPENAYDAGGVLPTGRTTFTNSTSEPIRVYRVQRWREDAIEVIYPDEV